MAKVAKLTPQSPVYDEPPTVIEDLEETIRVGRSGRYVVWPAIGREIMKRNFNIRPVNRRYVGQYARDIDNDYWPETGEGLRFDRQGRFRDGQHRVEAGIVADKPFVTWIFFNLADEVFRVVDTGYKRLPHHVLAEAGIGRYGTQIAAAAALMWRYEMNTVTDPSAIVSMHDRFDVLERWPEIQPSAEYVHGSLTRVTRIARSSAVAIVFHAHGIRQHGEQKTNYFFEKLNKPTELGEDDPIYALSERLQDSRARKERLIQHEVFGIWLPCWNTYVRNGRFRNGRFRSFDWQSEKKKAIIL